jgi:hypothetical protein
MDKVHRGTNPTIRTLARVALSLVVVGLGVSQPVGVEGQVTEPSAAELIASLTEAKSPESNGSVRIFTCGQSEQDRREQSTVRAIVALGQVAIPDLEQALDSIASLGKKSRFASKAGWLLLAYAKVQGPTASRRLQRMIATQELAFLRFNLDQAVALSLGLTSYVSGVREPGIVFLCRFQQPRDPLDQLILSWIQNDRPQLEKSLGPNAKNALNALLDQSSWESLRTELRQGNSDRRVGVGYVFETEGRWAEPEETLSAQKSGFVGTAEVLANPTLETRFKTSSGGACGKMTVNFVSTVEGMVTGVGPFIPNAYLIDERNLKGLLGLISSCAAAQ